MKALLDGFRTLGAARLAAMGAVAVALFVMLGLLMLRGGQTHYALLYGDLDLRESAQIVDLLNRQHVGYQIAAGGAQIMVGAEDVARVRLLLAKDGLPSGGSVGYELFDRGDALTTTEAQQQINQTRALEGEIARTIRAIQGVRGARVHLVLPRREPFTRDRQDAQASVLLTMTGAARLDREGVQAILNLVAAAVPGLRPQNIAVIDSRGTMLARAGEPVAAAAAQGAEELRHATELRLARAVEEMLERSLGPGHVRAEAAVEMDFDRINETQEKYDPEGQVPRSQQSVTTSNRSTEKEPATTVQNNLPNADAGGTQTGTQENRQEETTNYEIGRTVRTLVREQPSIKRISLAVMIDGVDVPDADGKPGWHPRSAEEVARLTTLVQSAIGFNAQRGDRVEIVSLRFAGSEEAGTAAPAGLLGLPFERGDVMRLAETLLLGAIAVVALLLVLRPMVARLTLAPAGMLAAGGVGAAMGSGGMALAGPGVAGGGAALLGVPTPGLPALPAPAGGGGLPGANASALIEDESMVSIANIEGQLRASSMRRIAELVDKNPDETLAVVRGWMAEESL